LLNFQKLLPITNFPKIKTKIPKPMKRLRDSLIYPAIHHVPNIPQSSNMASITADLLTSPDPTLLAMPSRFKPVAFPLLSSPVTAVGPSPIHTEFPFNPVGTVIMMCGDYNKSEIFVKQF